MHDHLLDRGRKLFCRYCLRTFITEEILRCHSKDCFKTSGKQAIKMPKKGGYNKFQNFGKKNHRS